MGVSQHRSGPGTWLAWRIPLYSHPRGLHHLVRHAVRE